MNVESQIQRRDTRLLLPEQGGVEEAVKRLQAGQLVALPTETVYGLCARADDPVAIRSIFEAKGRPVNHPLIVHLHNLEAFSFWVEHIPDVVRRLAEAFCPGPLTFVLPLRFERDRTVTGGQEWVGLRIPSHPLALDVLKRGSLSVGAPSANRFGRISPTSSQAVLQELDGYIDAVLEGGVCEVGIESTIIKVEQGRLVLLRPGHIGFSALESVSGWPVVSSVSQSEKGTESIRVSGQLDSHYAPIKPAYRISVSELDRFIGEWGKHDWVMAPSSLFGDRLKQQLTEQGVSLRLMSNDPIGYAKQLYACLREGDVSEDVQRIWLIALPDASQWDAVRDRVLRATRVLLS